jgi:hypothetical protein
MYEICALLRQPKARKPRKPAAKRIGIGTRVWVGYGGKQGIVVERHPNGRWWNVRVDGMEDLHGFDRSIMKAV